MDASIRQLKADLSGFIRRAAAGEPVTVRVHNRAVARIVPVPAPAALGQLRGLPGLRWSGGKPRGASLAGAAPRGQSVARWASQDRR